MHLYYISRGIKQSVDNMISDLQAQYFPYGDPKKGLQVQLSVRPIQMWEMVFPKEHMNTVLKTVGYPPTDDWRNLYFATLRKMLKAKKVPADIDMTKVIPKLVRGREFAGFDLIGMREDKIWPSLDKNGNQNEFAGYEQL